MIHASKFQPQITPLNGPALPMTISRAQAMDPTGALNRQKINEIGRLETVGWVKKTPTIGYKMTQMEYGSFDFWRNITNSEASVQKVTETNFRIAKFDICAFLTDDDGSFRGTLLYPTLRTVGFDLNIGNPDATIERTFNFVGEKSVIFRGTAPYFVNVDKTAAASGDNVIDCSTRVPAINPDVPVSFSEAKKYIFRVMRTRAGISTLLLPDEDYSYSSVTKEVTIIGCEPADFYRVFYATATAPATLFTPNDVDAAGLNADTASIYLYIPASGEPTSQAYVYRLQSVSIAVAFTRSDLKEIGNPDIVQFGINEYKVTVKLGRILEKFTIEEVLRGAGANYPVIDVSKLSTNVSLIVKIFTDNTKETLSYGMKFDKLSPTDISQGAAANQYVKADNTLEGETFTISQVNSDLGGL